MIFSSTFGKIFNNIQIDLRESKGNLYVSDVSDPYVYKNFASYFNFKQPAWMGNTNYRKCVLGNQTTGAAGLWQAGMNGGTQLGMKQVVNALSDGTAIFESLTDADYFTAYNNYYELTGEGLDLPKINSYDETQVYDENDIILYNDNFYQYISQASGTVSISAFSSIDDTSSIVCVNDTYKNILFKKSYNETDSLVITTITDTSSDTYNVNDLVNINDNYYEVRKQIEGYYNLVSVSDTAPDAYGIANGAFYYNTHDESLYKLENGSWELSMGDLTADAIYLDQSTGNLYQYDADPYVTENTLIPQTSLRDVNNLCNKLKFGVIPLDLDAIYELKGTEYYLISLGEPITEKDYIFYGTYEEDLDTDPISYTHNYLLNTYQVTFTNWKRRVIGEKYLVYGNRLKLNNQNIIYPDVGFQVYTDETMTQLVSNVLYTIDAENGYLIWNYDDNKPENGSYVWLNYYVDIRSDIKKLIELVKFPQVNIRYVWKETLEEE